MNKNINFIEYWNEYKKQYVFGEDYIDIDCGEFIAICPSIFKVMHDVKEFRTEHCVTNDKRMWDYHNKRAVFSLKKERASFSGKYKTFMDYESRYLDLVKVFFFRKNETNSNFSDEPLSLNIEIIKQSEFTGWLSPNASKMIDYFHLQNNLTSTSYPFCKAYYDDAISLIGDYIPKIIKEFNLYKKELRKKLFEDVFHRDFYKSGFYKTFINE